MTALRIAVVTGGRNYPHRDRVFAALDAWAPHVLVHGGATGADSHAAAWCEARGVQAVALPVNRAQWGRYGGKAGPARNRLMARIVAGLASAEPPPVVACIHFPGGGGTASMRRAAKDAGIPLVDGERRWDPDAGWASVPERARC